MSRVLLTLILLAAPISRAHAETDAEAEIRSLIQAVRDSGCEFDRNGTRYPAERAAEHLELKYSRGKRYATPQRHLLSTWLPGVRGVESLTG